VSYIHTHTHAYIHTYMYCTAGVETETDEERDFRAQGMREDNKRMLHALMGLAEEHPSLADTIQMALADAGIAPPSRPASARSEVSSIMSEP
jgi:hypothetical protein